MKTVTRDDTQHGVEYVTRAEAEEAIAAWRIKAKELGLRFEISGLRAGPAGGESLPKARALLGRVLQAAILKDLQCEEEIREAIDLVDAALTWGDQPKRNAPQASATQEQDNAMTTQQP